ncbi:MAG: molecular chaperone DnaJ [Acidimicrobiales bacterium]|nr:J domain-containing protein [Actinomycetota bacterium]
MAGDDDFYALLGVSRSANDDELKRAYRQRARELHPDTNSDPAAEERFKKITVAYETLRDPDKRRRYDTFGPDGVRGAGAGGQGAGGFSAEGFAGLGDLFEQFFGGSPFGQGGNRRRAGPPPGPDMEVSLELGFREAVFGGKHEVRLRLPLPCDVCSATGARPGTSAETCGTCGGTGEVRQIRQSILGQMVTSGPCGRCGGLGQVVNTPCDTCRGEGRRTLERTYTVEVPAGVDNGNTLRLPNSGGAGPRGGPRGDLFVHLRVRADERFQRQGADLVHVLHLPLTQAALGAHLRYDTLDGTEDLVIPRGTQSGKVFRLRGRGVPHVDGRGRGDLLVQVMVDTPADLTKEQDNLLRLLAVERGEDVAPSDSGFLAKIRSAFK